MEEGRTTDFSWDFILDKIEQEECLLVLGPEAYTGPDGVSYQRNLIKHLNPESNPRIRRYYEDDGFFLFDDASKRTLACHDIKSFYKTAKTNETLLKLAAIPFHLMMTVTPDILLNQSFEEQGFSYDALYYKKNKEPDKIKRKPSKTSPLLYNLFGCLKSEESLILTHNDLYDYFKSIFARKSMPESLKDGLHQIKNILLLGVPFDQWYMQLLLRELEIHNTGYSFLRYAANQTLPGEIRTFCTEQFNINFIYGQEEDHHELIPWFVRELHARCEARGMLRRPGTEEQTLGHKIRDLVSEGDLEEALGLMEEYAEEENRWVDEIAMLHSRFRSFNRRAQKGVLREEERSVQLAEISDTILSTSRTMNL